MKFLAGVTDPRSRQGRRHPLTALLALLCLAMLSGIHGYMPAAEWAQALSPETKKALGFPNGKTPVASTLYEVLKVVSSEELEAAIRLWCQAVIEALSRAAPKALRPDAFQADAGAIAVDGKALRGSWKRGAKVGALLAVMSHRLGILLAQAPMGCKTGEVTALRKLLKQLTLDGLVITTDALFTQRDLAETIIQQQGEYVMRVKLNQPTLVKEVEALFAPCEFDKSRRQSEYTTDHGHGRIEERSLVSISLKPGDVTWPDAKQVFRIRSERMNKHTKKRETMIQYGITSLSREEANATRLLCLVRGHWGIENKVFWVRDVVMREDASSVKTAAVVASLAVLRGAVLTLLQIAGEGRTASAVRKFNANRKAAMDVLGCS